MEGIGKKTQLKADLMLILVTLFWGVGYYFMNVCLTELTTFTLNAYRFLGAFIVAFALSAKRAVKVNKTTLIYSALLGTALTVVYTLATFGLMYTTQSNAGFLCALAVVFTPILGGIIYKRRPDKKLLIVIVLVVIGIALLSITDTLTFALGDILCILCSLAYSVHLILTEHAVKKPEVDAFLIGVYQLGFTGLINLVFALILEKPVLPQSPGVWGSLAVIAIFCSGMAFIVQSVAQQYTSADHVGVIYTAEPVFAAVSAFLLAGEVLKLRNYIGGVILVLAIVLMEIDWQKLFTRKKEPQGSDAQ